MSFEVGDKVISINYGNGIITRIDKNLIVVLFENLKGDVNYYPDGRTYKGSYCPDLYHAEGFVPPSCKEPERKPKFCNFKPFDKVLVRDSKEDEWTIEFFSYYDPSATAPYKCLYEWWVYCIPYETNEDKCGNVTEE